MARVMVSECFFNGQPLHAAVLQTATWSPATHQNSVVSYVDDSQGNQRCVVLFRARDVVLTWPCVDTSQLAAAKRVALSISCSVYVDGVALRWHDVSTGLALANWLRAISSSASAQHLWTNRRVMLYLQCEHV